jgi:hypothetical protein
LSFSNKVEAERDGTMRILSDESVQIAARSAEVKKEEERMAMTLNALDREKADVEEEKCRIQDYAIHFKKRSEEIEEMGLVS